MPLFRGTGGSGESSTDAFASEVAEQAAIASTKASQAAASATSAANAQAAAETAKTAAQSAQANAETAETNAETAETNAETAETNAETAENAAVAAKNSAETAKTAADAAQSAAEVAKTAAETAETNAETAETNAAASATTATTKASEASSSATSASSSASSASTSATNAATSATAAQTAQTAAEAAQDAIDGLYLGAQSSNPTVDLNGNAVTAGDWYFNTSDSTTRIYDGSVWNTINPDLVGDSSPQLGGNLDLNSNNITGTGNVSITGNVVLSGTVDGRDVATDGTKLDGIEASATADQTDAEIRAAVEAATDSNVFTDADHSKLNAIEASADVTDTANVTAAGALMDSEVTNLSQVKAFNTSDYATAAQGTTADSALQNVVEDTTPQLGGNLDLNSNNITGTGNIDVTGTVTADGITSSADILVQESIPQLVLDDTDVTDAKGTIVQAGSTLFLRSRGGTSAYGAIRFARNNGSDTTALDINSAGDISFYNDAGTSQDLKWDASASRLGLGTTAPARALHIDIGADNEGLRLTSSDTYALYEAIDGGDTVAFGAVQGQFHVRVAGANQLKLESNATTTIQGSSGSLTIDNQANSPDQTLMVFQADMGTNNRNFQIKSPATDSSSAPFRFLTGNSFAFEIDTNSSAFVIDSNANIGIGTNPDSDLHIYGGGNTILNMEHFQNGSSRIYFSSTSDGRWGAINATNTSGARTISITPNSSTGDSRFGGLLLGQNEATIGGVFDTDYGLNVYGNVGIGITVTDAKLDIGTTNSAIDLKLTNTQAEAAGSSFYNVNMNTGYAEEQFTIYSGDVYRGRTWIGFDNYGSKITFGTGTAGTERMVIYNNGSVGIGTESPDTLLELKGADPILTIRDSETSVANGNATLRLAESDGGDTLGTYYDVGLESGNLTFGYAEAGGATTERMRIQGSSGDVMIVDGSSFNKVLDASDRKNFKTFMTADATVNASATYTTKNVFNTTASINVGSFTVASSGVTVPEDGVYMVMANMVYNSTALRANPGFKFSINGTGQAETALSSYIRATTDHNEASSSMSTLYSLSANDVIGLQFAIEGGAGTVNLETGSHVAIYKV